MVQSLPWREKMAVTSPAMAPTATDMTAQMQSWLEAGVRSRFIAVKGGKLEFVVLYFGLAHFVVFLPVGVFLGVE